ncbi:auxin efflux carrier [Nadsonia fulvescens var. elongata DSM 6958]|uniref:Auxin efflux carrier n=1 Tax=Nadsonia fulvescens var. elongata DSM 6958 TaxID=857566 RepID=A0A1E3PIM5_9ASCO|nr:auxin efflux carrier [Nadsonia fulvescens var. elongata DSM 6958]
MSGEISYLYLAFLVFQTVFQVVFVCLFGFAAARYKLLTPSIQKHISNLNVNLFTPCLIFSKLASSLSLAKMFELSIIPLLFVLTTGVSYCCSRLTSCLLRLNKPESNFVTAMAVFGNSNSLPVSLTLGLAYTLPDLLWDNLPDDNPEKVATRGILYLLIFQQLGQMLRWSWGYNTLLSKQKPELAENEEDDALFYGNNRSLTAGDIETAPGSECTPLLSSSLSAASDDDSTIDNDAYKSVSAYSNSECDNGQVSILPTLSFARRFFDGVMSFMNPPLYTMIGALIVAAIPSIQAELFTKNGFIQNTFTKAVQSLATVAVPLILVVLGANLNPDENIKSNTKHTSKIIFASLISRIILPSFVLLPLFSILVKLISVSILDDPIFLIVCFLLTIAPPAIQLSQICQLNEIFEKEMAGVLFWGYAVLTLPTTIAAVVLSLRVLDWAGKLMN